MHVWMGSSAGGTCAKACTEGRDTSPMQARRVFVSINVDVHPVMVRGQNFVANFRYWSETYLSCATFLLVTDWSASVLPHLQEQNTVQWRRWNGNRLVIVCRLTQTQRSGILDITTKVSKQVQDIIFLPSAVMYIYLSSSQGGHEGTESTRIGQN